MSWFLGDLSQFFFWGGGKNGNFGKIFDKGLNWQLTIPQLGEIWKISNININYWPSDYIHTEFGRDQLNSQKHLWK